MTKQEAINILSTERCKWCPFFDRRSLECMGENECFEATRLAIECIEKQIPKKPNIIKFGLDGFISWRCPSCGASARQENVEIYCHNCGQAIDWSDNE